MRLDTSLHVQHFLHQRVEHRVPVHALLSMVREAQGKSGSSNQLSRKQLANLVGRALANAHASAGVLPQDDMDAVLEYLESDNDVCYVVQFSYRDSGNTSAPPIVRLLVHKQWDVRVCGIYLLCILLAYTTNTSDMYYVNC